MQLRLKKKKSWPVTIQGPVTFWYCLIFRTTKIPPCFDYWVDQLCLAGPFFPSVHSTCLVPVFRWLCSQQKKKKRKRLSKPLWSTGSHHRADPNDCSRLAHIWGLNETNDLRQTTGELFLHPQYAWKLPGQLSFHRTITFIHTTDVENCRQSLGFWHILSWQCSVMDF